MTITPLTDAQREHMLGLEGYLILGRPPGSNVYQGYAERSWSMGWYHDFAVLFWSSKNATSNLGGKFEIDGKKDAGRCFDDLTNTYPDWTIEVWDWKDPALPVTLDYEKWFWGSARDDQKLSGVHDKFRARNLFFSMKE